MLAGVVKICVKMNAVKQLRRKMCNKRKIKNYRNYLNDEFIIIKAKEE